MYIYLSVSCSENEFFYVGINTREYYTPISFSKEQKNIIKMALNKKFNRKITSLIEKEITYNCLLANTEIARTLDKKCKLTRDLIWNEIKAVCLSIFNTLYTEYQQMKTTYYTTTQINIDINEQKNFCNAIFNIVADYCKEKNGFDNIYVKSIGKVSYPSVKYFLLYKNILIRLIIEFFYTYSIIDFCGNCKDSFFFMKDLLSKEIRNICKMHNNHLQNIGLMHINFDKAKLNITQHQINDKKDNKEKIIFFKKCVGSLLENFVYDVRFILFLKAIYNYIFFYQDIPKQIYLTFNIRNLTSNVCHGEITAEQCLFINGYTKNKTDNVYIIYDHKIEDIFFDEHLDENKPDIENYFSLKNSIEYINSVFDLYYASIHPASSIYEYVIWFKILMAENNISRYTIESSNRLILAKLLDLVEYLIDIGFKKKFHIIYIHREHSEDKFMKHIKKNFKGILTNYIFDPEIAKETFLKIKDFYSSIYIDKSWDEVCIKKISISNNNAIDESEIVKNTSLVQY
ncbi:hypothetical protein COBT_000651 [Conglomerata obtusa]